MVDAQAVDLAAGDEIEHQPVRRVEHLGALHAQRGQLVDVEEAAVVDLVGGDAPVGQPVGLLLDQFVEQRRSWSRSSAEPLNALTARSIASASAGKSRASRASCALVHFLVAMALGAHRLGCSRAAPAGGRAPLRGWPANRRPTGGSAFGVSRCCARVEQPRIGGRVDRQAVLVVAQHEAAARRLEAELQLAAFEHDAVLVAEDRQQHLAGERRIDWSAQSMSKKPANIDAGAVLEHVEPPAVVAAQHAHVVGHDVASAGPCRGCAAWRRAARNPRGCRSPDSARCDRRCRSRAGCRRGRAGRASSSSGSPRAGPGRARAPRRR